MKYIHLKYEGPNSYQSKDMANVKVFAGKQTDGPKTICPGSIEAGAQKSNNLYFTIPNIYAANFSFTKPGICTASPPRQDSCHSTPCSSIWTPEMLY